MMKRRCLKKCIGRAVLNYKITPVNQGVGAIMLTGNIELALILLFDNYKITN